jgi:hypothetical protein
MLRFTFRSTLLFILLTPFLSMAQLEIDHWETVVFNDDIWSYRVGASAPPSDWMQPQFNDITWPNGPGGFGYGDGDDNTIIPATISLCIRIKFDLADTSKIKMALLHADYDDAFIAYLNGAEIARGNFGPAGTNLAYNGIPPTYHEATLYQGGTPESFPIYPNTFDQLIVENENVLAIQINNYTITSSDFSSNFFLSLAIADTSTDFAPTPSWFQAPFIGTQLPLFHINTNGEAILDEPKIDAVLKVVTNDSGAINYIYSPGNDYDGPIAIEIRGASSQSFEKKNYGFETRDQNGDNNNVSLLGMPDENDWVLHGPYSDKSLIRNALTFQIGRDLMDYASRTRFCELVINNEYRGVYLLMEKIKRDDNRVDIANLKTTDTSGDELTGGYVFQIDRDDTSLVSDGWYSPYGSNPFYAFHSPKHDQLVTVQKDYIENWMTDFEFAMTQPSFDSTYDNYIDIASFVDYFLINELTKHIDAFKLSFYMYKRKNSNGGKLHMGPIWDFNLAFGNFDFGCNPDPNGWIYSCTSRAFWLNKIMQVPAVQDQMQCRWKELREQKLATSFLMSSIDSMVLELGPAVDRNFEEFDILGTYVWPNDFIGNTHTEEISFLKSWLVQRLTWMDSNMFGDPNFDCDPPTPALGLVNEKLHDRLIVHPNPFQNQVTFTINDAGASDGELFIYNPQGQLITSMKLARQATLNLNNLSSGIYFYVYKDGAHGVQKGKLVKQ